MANKIKKGDTVKVITGKDKDKEGKVLAVKGDKVLVEGVAVVSKHTKPSAGNQQGGIVTKEAFIDISNVMYCENGETGRIGFKVEDGKKFRVMKKKDHTVKVIDEVTSAK